MPSNITSTLKWVDRRNMSHKNDKKNDKRQQTQTVGIHNDEQNVPNQKATDKKLNGREYKTNLKRGNSEGTTNYYDTLKLSLIKLLKDSDLSMDHRLYPSKIKIEYKT